jgi:hypothetical protein
MNVYNKIKLGSGTLDASSILDIASIDKGVLFPRMTTLQRDAIATPSASLFIYNVDTLTYQYWNGTIWTSLAPGEGTGNWTFNGSQFYPTNKTTVTGAAPARLVQDTESFVVGRKYIIGVNGGPLDVTNIGAPSNNSQVSFYATGTTPTSYSTANSAIYEYNKITEGTEVLFSDNTGFLGFQWFTYRGGRFEGSLNGGNSSLDTWDALISYMTPANFPSMDGILTKPGTANTFSYSSKPWAFALSYITLPLSSTVQTPDATTNYGWSFEVDGFYQILDYVAGDDFTNIGAVSNTTGEWFIATGSTPSNWMNGSIIKHFRFTNLTDLGLIGTPLVIGQTYQLIDNIGGDDFTNIGAISNTDGEIFTATGTTPTLWSTSNVRILFQPDLLTIGETYEILQVNGSDDFTNIGANSNTPGEIFTATGTTPSRWVDRSRIRVYFTTLETGAEYEIVTYVAGDNFTNVGAATNASATKFIATGTTPATWTNGSVLNKTEPYTVEGLSVNSAIVQQTFATAQSSTIGGTENRPEGDFNSMSIENWTNISGQLNILSGKLLIGGSETGGYIQSGDHAVQILAANPTQGPLTLIGGSGLVQVWNDTSPSQAFAWGIAQPGNIPDGNFYMSRWSPGWATALTILNLNGYTGIGTTNPISALHIGADSGNADLTFSGGGSTRNIIVESVFGPGSPLNIIAGGGSGPGAPGGTVSLLGGDSASSDGGNVIITGGSGATAGNILISSTGAGNVAIGSTSNPISKLEITGDGLSQFRLVTTGTPTSTNDTSGNIGDVAWDRDFLYIKTDFGGGQWGRIPLDYNF